MKKLEVVEAKEYSRYVFKNLEDESKSELIIVLYLVEKLKVGDKLLLHENLLNRKSEEFVETVYFEPTKEFSPKEIRDKNLKEFAVLNRNKKNIALKRIYG